MNNKWHYWDYEFFHKDKWYCEDTGELENIEFNPQWLADGKPMNGDGEYPYEWVARCSACGEDLIMQQSEYNCPNCGWNGTDRQDDYVEFDSVTHVGHPIAGTPFLGWGPSKERMSGEFSGRDWEEFWECPICGEKFSYWNSDI